MREAQLLRELGREVVVFSWIKDPSSVAPDQETREGIEIRRAKVAPPRSPLARALGYRSIMRRFAEAIVALKPGAIICHDLEMLWSAVLAKRALGVPLLYHAHEDWPAMVSERSRLEGMVFRRLEQRLVREVDHVYTVGEELAKKYRAWGKPTTVQYGSKALADMPHLTDQEKRAIREEVGWRMEDPIVCIAGSLGRDEALPAILEAIKPLDDRVRLFIVGGLPEKVRAAMALADAKGLNGRVASTGPLPTAGYLRRVAACDIGLALFYETSRNQRFVAPLKLFDYMGVGLPAIVSDSPEMKRIVVEDCGFGLAVDPRDPVAIRMAMTRLLEGERLRASMREAALACFRERYCWDRMRESLRASHPIFRRNST
jgi:glycosyltransferase involved in cell wall biosynthesis